ncbi:sugar transferase [Propionigenium maris DSM 9537]|uniref:Sugar transferase n=1 Tax=Propionigenium maris DSM 9537 TaxID=1123000 RepID=A0A9W6GK60_9FUSO|nr:sugar transferase [Propionigenium maris]GLI55783.1 sugar transferase [Propionigenium maris DSM 9537]
MYRNFFKRIMDIALALTLIIVFWWIYILIAVLVKINLGSPIIFKQDRPGRNSKIFTMYKFRTMLNTTDNFANLLAEKERLISFGIHLRSSSLDELPQIWNVLRGEMSFIGPRPLLVEYLNRYSPEQARRHEVKPGITGWAQVKGRNSISWNEKFKLDVEYVDNYSFLMDLKIILLTLKWVSSREGISPEGESIGEDFWGDENPKNRN